MVELTELLEPIAAQFRNMGIPQPIVQWGHPVMMAIVVLVMGNFVGWTGWRGRLTSDKEVAIKSRVDHRKLAPWMFIFIAAGYTGGVLSLVMQHQPILESSHFWTGSTVLLLLGINTVISIASFWGESPTDAQRPRSVLRTFHAYLGTAALGLLFIHAVLGLKLGLSI